MAKTLLIVDHTGVTPFAYGNVGAVPVQDIVSRRAAAMASALSADIAVIASNGKGDAIGESQRYELTEHTALGYLALISRAAKGYDEIVHLKADMPLADTADALRAIKLHRENFAYYTYGENYPAGVLPRIYKYGTLDRLTALAEGKKCALTYDFIHETVFIDPNFFEIEVSLSHDDMRYYRLSFRADTKRNVLLLGRIGADDDSLSYDAAAKRVLADAALRRTLPAYVEMELTTARDISPIYFPSALSSRPPAAFSREQCAAAVRKIVDFCGDVHLSFSLYGEPLMNTAIRDIISDTLAHPSVTLYLETNALRFDRDLADWMISLKEPRLKTIFHLDAVDPKLYAVLYPGGDMTTVLANIEYYLIRNNKNAYVQIRKMKDNFDHLMAFYKYFEKYDASIILQKYDSCRGSMPDREVGDLSPLTCVGCWHCARDLAIFADGSIRLCREDVTGERVYGNIHADTLAQVWQRGDDDYRATASRSLPFCGPCNEWYTFNF